MSGQRISYCDEFVFAFHSQNNQVLRGLNATISQFILKIVWAGVSLDEASVVELESIAFHVHHNDLAVAAAWHFASAQASHPRFHCHLWRVINTLFQLHSLGSHNAFAIASREW